MTLATYNRYVDNATGVSRIGCSCEPPGVVLDGGEVLYWAEDLKRKPFKAKGKHRAKSGRVFFLRSRRIPRKHSLFHKWSRLFGGWR